MRVLSAIACALLIAGCAEPAHTNPFDPDTPESQQARATLAGTVRLEPAAGVPPSLSGVLVGVSGPKASRTAFTDAGGAWRVSDVPPGTYTVSASKDGWRDGAVSGVTVTLDDGGATVAVADLLLALGRGEVTGRVALRLPDGSEEIAGGAAISLRGMPRSALSSADGTFLLSAVPAGTYVLDVAKVGYVPGSTTGVVVTDQGIASTGTVSIQTDPGWLAGTVAVPAPAAANAALVRARGFTLAGTPWESSAHPAQDGTYLVSDLPAGSYQVTFELADHQTVAMSAAVAPGAPTDLPPVALARHAGAVSGVARLSLTSDHAGVQVTLTPQPTAADPAPLPAATALTDAGGSWRVEQLPVGTYRVDYAKAPGYLPQSSSVIVVKGSVSAGTVTLLLDVSGSISGVARVARPAGADGGIAVSLAGADLNGNPVLRTTSTSPTGAYQLSGLPQGTYTITFSRARYEARTLSGAFVAAGRAVGAEDVTLPVASGGLSGAVALDVSTVPGLGPIADRSGTVVTLVDGTEQVGATVTDASGTFLFASVPAIPASGSTYALSARRTHFTTDTRTVAPEPGTLVPGNDLALTLQAGALEGAVDLFDDVGGTGVNASAAGATVTVAGTAFTGEPWTPPVATTGPSGTWSFVALPPGTFGVVVLSDGRACGALPSQGVQAGATTTAGAVRCTDTIPPGVVGLGPPDAPPGGVSGWVSGDAVTIPVVTQASDGTRPASNLRGYQVAVGAAPDWGASSFVPATAPPAPPSPTSLIVGGLVDAGTNTVWVRAVDFVGNAGQAVGVPVVRDGSPPPVPTISTPQAYVPNTTTSVMLTGADSDPSFLRYEACWASVPATDACGAVPCVPGPVAQTFPLPLLGERTCIWARAVDRSGNASADAVASVVSDLHAPAPPAISPGYDPATLSVRSGWVDVFVEAGATDLPGTGAPWAGVAWIEVDSGLGFEPLCPAAACHEGGVYDPCGACACTDERLRCSAPAGGAIAALRVPLANGGATRVAVRAVDLAGNVGDAVGQEIRTEAGGAVVAVTPSGADYRPRISGTVVSYEHYESAMSGMRLTLVDLGPDGRPGAGDPRCEISATASTAAPASGALVAYADGTGVRGVRKAAGWCAAPSTFPIATTTNVQDVAAAGERVVYVRWGGASSNLVVVEPGADGRVGSGDDEQTLLLDRWVIRPIQAGGSAVLAASMDGSTAPAVWRLLSAPGDFADGFQEVEVPIAWDDLPALARDGAMLAFTDGTSGPRKVCARYAGADRTFDATDEIACVAPPPDVPALPQTWSIVADGTHVVVSTKDKRLVHWDAGPDGRLGTADDTLATIRQSTDEMKNLAISGGLLVWEEGAAIRMHDLSSVRWETLDGYLAGAFVWVRTNGAGTLLWAAEKNHARSPDGYETVSSGALVPEWGAAGADLVHRAPGGLRVLGPHPASGLFFDPGAPSTLVYSTSNELAWFDVKPGRALFMEYQASVLSLRVLEGVDGSLSAPGVDVVEIGTIANSELKGFALAGSAALYSCGAERRTCVQDAGADGAFGTGDDPARTTLAHPPGSERAALPVLNAYLHADGGRLAASEWPAVLGTITVAGGLYAIDAGPDARFATADDSGFTVSPDPLFPDQFSIAGDWLAYLAGGAPGGTQVYLLNLRDRSVRQLTSHFSTKDNVVVERSGRVFWMDGVFTTGSIFTRTP